MTASDTEPPTEPPTAIDGPLLRTAFVLVLGLLSKFYMYDRLAVVPLNQTTTSTSETLPGADAEYLDVDNDLTITNGPLRSVRVVTGDVDLSKEASDELDTVIGVQDTAAQSLTSVIDSLSANQDPVSAIARTMESPRPKPSSPSGTRNLLTTSTAPSPRGWWWRRTTSARCRRRSSLTSASRTSPTPRPRGSR